MVRDEISRTSITDPATEFIDSWGLKRVDVVPPSQWFLRGRLRDLSLIFPCDRPDRVKSITQYDEKRFIRASPGGMEGATRVVFLGDGCSWW